MILSISSRECVMCVCACVCCALAFGGKWEMSVKKERKIDRHSDDIDDKFQCAVSMCLHGNSLEERCIWPSGMRRRKRWVEAAAGGWDESETNRQTNETKMRYQHFAPLWASIRPHIEKADIAHATLLLSFTLWASFFSFHWTECTRRHINVIVVSRSHPMR